MGIGDLRNAIRPLCATLFARPTDPSASVSIVARSTFFHSPPSSSISHFLSTLNFPARFLRRSIHLESLASLAPKPFDSLTDTRFPKRRPSDKSRPKRASIRPPGPYIWVEHAPGQPTVEKKPNKGSVKLRNEKKRRRQRLEFIKAEAKKRKEQLQEAKRKKREKQIERKMAAVAREREWAQRLVELQRLEEEKKKSVA